MTYVDLVYEYVLRGVGIELTHSGTMGHCLSKAAESPEGESEWSATDSMSVNDDAAACERLADA